MRSANFLVEKRDSLDKIKLIATDMDHTLLTDEGNLPPNFFELVDRLTKEKIYFALASGRPLATLKKMFPDHLDEFIFIADNGGLIEYQNETLYKSLIEPATYQNLVAKIKAIGVVPIVCGIDATFIEKRDQHYEDYFKQFYTKMIFVDDLESLTEDADKVTAYLPSNNSRDIYEKQFYPRFDQDFSLAVSDTMWIDLMNKEVDKGAAIRKIGERLNILPTEMMAFGDGDNDIQMLQAVRYSVAVKNAEASVKQHATYETATNNEFGVTKMIEALLISLK